MQKHIRQGDVLLKPIATPKTKAKEVREYTVALGEATGHHHTLYPISAGAMMKVWEKEGVKRFKINEPWALRHQEHDEIIIGPGTYEIGMEREYDPFQKIMKKVVD